MVQSASEQPEQGQEAVPHLLKPPGQILSTMESDGSRRWLKPKVSDGRYLRRRRIVAALLIFVFTLLPFLKYDGRPLLLLDIMNREFFVFGLRILPTDTAIMALGMVFVFLSIFWFTAVFGRVWCGWACPQTVYMEFVFRPIERWADGTWGKGGKAKGAAVPWRQVVKYGLYFVISFYLAHTFLAYFVGMDNLIKWVWRSTPFEHPWAFGIVTLVTIAMLFDFGFFREQLCIIACPYGRFQSVLLDRSSRVVSYDKARGEPRHKGRRKEMSPDLPIVGDCVDCRKCVTTCPTGIDIRDGLQLECINCAQCIDACDDVMEKIGRPQGLIHYSSQMEDEGQRFSLFRPRILIYPIVLLALVTGIVTLVMGRKSFDVAINRERGLPYQKVESDRIANTFTMHLVNRSRDDAVLTLVGVEPAEVDVKTTSDEIPIEGEKSVTAGLRAVAPASLFKDHWLPVKVTFRSDKGDERVISFRMAGP